MIGPAQTENRPMSGQRILDMLAPVGRDRRGAGASAVGPPGPESRSGEERSLRALLPCERALAPATTSPQLRRACTTRRRLLERLVICCSRLGPRTRSKGGEWPGR